MYSKISELVPHDLYETNGLQKKVSMKVHLHELKRSMNLYALHVEKLS